MFGSVSTDAMKLSTQEKVMKQNKSDDIDVVFILFPLMSDFLFLFPPYSLSFQFLRHYGAV